MVDRHGLQQLAVNGRRTSRVEYGDAIYEDGEVSEEMFRVRGANKVMEGHCLDRGAVEKL